MEEPKRTKEETREPKPKEATREDDEEASSTRRQLQLSLQGLLGFRVWAVVGDPDETEDIADHLMDCGKTVFSVSATGDGAHYKSTAQLNSNPDTQRAEVLAFVLDGQATVESVEDAIRLGLGGIILHPGVDSFSPDIVSCCN